MLIIDGAELDENFARAARNIPQVDVLPQPGANVYDIMRRDTLVLTKDAVAASGGAPEMSKSPSVIPRRQRAEAHRRARLRHHPPPGDHRKGDAWAREHNQVTFRVPLDADQARDQGGGRSGLFKRQGEGGQHPAHRRARPSASAAVVGKRCDYKKAIVTLAEGQSIDVTTGV